MNNSFCPAYAHRLRSGLTHSHTQAGVSASAATPIARKKGRIGKADSPEHTAYGEAIAVCLPEHEKITVSYRDPLDFS